MSDADDRKARFLAWTNSEFNPGHAPGFNPPAEERRAQALQYIAAQLWHIRQALEAIAHSPKAQRDGTDPEGPGK